MNTRKSLTTILLILFDVTYIHLSFILAFWMKNYLLQLQGQALDASNLASYFDLFIWISVGTVVIFYFSGLYVNWNRKDLIDLIYLTVIGLVITMLFVVTILFFLSGFTFPKSVIIMAFGLQVIFIVSGRITYWVFAKKKHGRRSVLLISRQPNSTRQIEDKIFNSMSGWLMVSSHILSSDLDDLSEKVQHYDMILINSDVDEIENNQIISCCLHNRKEVLVVPNHRTLLFWHADIETIDDITVWSIKPLGLSPLQKGVKRFVDIVGSSVLFVVLSPVFIATYFLIRFSSEGSSFYKQERVGKNGRKYNMYKFRSMKVDAELDYGPRLAVENDPRITRIGRFIRATRIDEIPQLINVVKGDMSLVGPRPEREFFTSQFEIEYPEYKLRNMVKPGITGLAQTMGNYSTSVENKLRFDLMYIRNYSFLLDVKILIQTVRVTLKSKQAKGVSSPSTEQEGYDHNEERNMTIDRY